MNLHEAAEIISIALTLPTVFLSAWVVLIFFGQAQSALRESPALRKPVGWFAMGITVGFAGSVLDNIYWGVAWSACYVECYWLQSVLFKYGVFSNVPFRQVAGIMAAYFHLRCAMALPTHNDRESWKEIIRLINVLVVSCILGAVFVTILTFGRLQIREQFRHQQQIEETIKSEPFESPPFAFPQYLIR